MTRLLLALLAPCAFVLALAMGCSTECDRTDPDREVRYTGGNRDVANGYYETSSWEGPFLHFPAGRRFVIEHGLGRAPTVETYLSFSERGLAGDNNATESAGNQVVLETVDSQIVKLRNDSCAEFYLRVVASVPGPDAGASDAAADAAASD